ncbi:MAG TPA: hypothetical protein VMX57_01295, partial [Planctomycetota bacterium]|nr:hypothetical protein [Planctomycetota bacterium]
GKLCGVTIEDGKAWVVEVAWDAADDANGVLPERRVKSLGNVPPEYPGGDVRVWTGERTTAIIFGVTRNGKRWVVHNGREMGPYDGAKGSALSEDGDHYVFGARRDGKQFAVVDGKEGPAYDEVRDFRLSSDGRRLAYRAKRGDASFIVIDGREIRHSGYQKGRWFLYDMGFSPDGRHFYYVDRDEHGDFIVCDGYRGRHYAGISNARFSPDSRHLYFEATRNGLRVSVCDGLEGPGHGDIVQTRMDPETGRLRYLALRGEATLVELEWPADRDWQSGLEKLPD